MPSLRLPLITSLLALMLLATACSKGSTTAERTSITPPASTPVTTSAAPSPSSPPASETSSPSPSPTSTLEDGRHFVFIKSIDVSADPATVTFDLAYFLTGDAANQAAAARGDETPVPNDYYIVNDNPLLRTLSIGPQVEVRIIDWLDCCDLVDGTFSGLTAAVAKKHPKGSYAGRMSQYWITVTNGVIEKIEEQYLP